MTGLDLDAIRARWHELQNMLPAGLETTRSIVAEQSAADVPALLAEVKRLRAYANTTRYHQEQHAEAVRENAEVRKVVEAAQEWVEHEGESAHRALVAAVNALPEAAR